MTKKLPANRCLLTGFDWRACLPCALLWCTIVFCCEEGLSYLSRAALNHATNDLNS